MSDPTKTYRIAFETALAALIDQLQEAQEYVGQDHGDLAAIGTLINIDETYADMQAALRLFRNSRRTT